MEDLPPPQYVRAERVIDAMATFGRRRLEVLDPARAGVLAVLGGSFIALGALFSVVVAAGIGAGGPQRLVEGLAFSTGFFFVVLAEAVLFTEANVVLPATLLRARRSSLKVARFWAIAWAGNFVGTLLVGALVAAAQRYPEPALDLLREVVDAKMVYAADGTVTAWFEAVLSGVLANWMVGMAALFAMMGRTIVGKYVPVALAVTLFVAANFQHSPANMGYFSLLMAETDGPGWARALWWNIVPAGLGNIVGASVFVALPFWFVFRPSAAD